MAETGCRRICHLESVDWLDNQLLPGPVRDIPTAELEAAYYRQQGESAVVA